MNYIDPDVFDKKLKRIKTRWEMFYILCSNLSFKFPEQNRAELTNEATIFCMKQYKKFNWKNGSRAFSYFTTVAFNKMRTFRRVFYVQYEIRHRRLDYDSYD